LSNSTPTAIKICRQSLQRWAMPDTSHNREAMTDQGDPPTHLIAVQLDTLSVQEAAEALGVTPKTIRRRIKQGTLQGFKQPTSQGYEWRVRLDGQVDTQGIQVDTHTAEMGRELDTPAPSVGGQVDTQGTAEVALKALAVLEQIEHEHRAEVEQLRRDNQQLAGQVGFLQAKLQSAEERIKLLEAPKDEPEPARDLEPELVKRAPWWKRWIG
jgi:excisionase family DNA binding protein